MLSAIAGSMIRAGGLTMFSAASDSVMLCATVNAVTIDRELPERAAEQQQADQEQQVVGADQDVMDAGRHELADDRQRALARAGEVLERGAAAVENRLRQRLAFVDVQERLMLRIVGKHHRVDLQRARRREQRDSGA